MGKYFVPNMNAIRLKHNFCIYTRTGVVWFERLEEWIEREVALFTIHLTLPKINMSLKNGPFQKGKHGFSTIIFEGQAVSY